MRFANQRFEHVYVTVRDGDEYDGCYFRECVMVNALTVRPAYAFFNFDECHFDNCDFIGAWPDPMPRLRTRHSGCRVHEPEVIARRHA